MPHLPIPCALSDDAAYAVALRELAHLDAAGDGGTARWDELARRVEDYEARRAGYDLPRMRAALAAWSGS